MTEFDHIRWKNTDRVDAVFSLKNKHYNATAKIPGLNLGYNTIEEEERTVSNRKVWLEAAGADPLKTSWGIQVHGNNVQLVEKPGVYPNTDAIVTREPGFSLAVFVADCAAILLSDEENGVIAAVHAGWKSAVAGIVGKALKNMQDIGANMEKTQVFISPCISRKHFEVGEEVAARFPETVVDRTFKKPHVDLKSFVRKELTNGGIVEGNIQMEPGCTFADANQYYSFRREKEQSGRMMALITLKKR